MSTVRLRRLDHDVIAGCEERERPREIQGTHLLGARIKGGEPGCDQSPEEDLCDRGIATLLPSRGINDHSRSSDTAALLPASAPAPATPATTVASKRTTRDRPDSPRMRFDIMPLPEEGFLLRLETPSEPVATESAVQEFFQECAWSLAWQEEQGHEMYALVIAMPSVLELGPVVAAPSTVSFLAALCKFVKEHPFAVGAGRDDREPLRLAILVPPPDSTEGTEAAADAPSPSIERDIFAEATSRICCAFWQNEQIRVTRYVTMNVPFVPSQEVVNRMVVASGNRGDDGDHEDMERHFPLRPLLRCSPGFLVTLVAREVDRGDDPRDILQVELAGYLALSAVGATHAAALMDRVLNVFGPDGGIADGGGGRDIVIPPRRRRHAKIIVASERVADAVVARLHEHRPRPTTLRKVCLVAGTRSNLSVVHRFEGLDDHALDGTSLFRAAMSIPCVIDIDVAGFRLTGDLLSSNLSATNEAGEHDHSAAAGPLFSLALEECALPDDDSVHGAGAVVTSLLSGIPTLQHLNLRGTRLSPLAVSALCRALTAAGTDESLRVLQIGRGALQFQNCLDDESVAHFFRALPRMKCLRVVLVNHDVPAHLSRTVVDGVKDNYWLEQIVVQSLKEDEDADAEGREPVVGQEMWSYLFANEDGRRAAVYDAVVAMQQDVTAAADETPDDRRRIVDAKVGSALRILELLARSDVRHLTSRFLCVRLFLPAALGGGGGGNYPRREGPSGRR